MVDIKIKVYKLIKTSNNILYPLYKDTFSGTWGCSTLKADKLKSWDKTPNLEAFNL